MELGTIVALTVGMLVIIIPVALIWYINISKIYRDIKEGSEEKPPAPAYVNLTCSLNSDCPPGYVCVGGYCVPRETQ